MLALVENVWEQIDKHNILKDDNTSKIKSQTASKSVTSSILTLNNISQTQNG